MGAELLDAAPAGAAPVLDDEPPQAAVVRARPATAAMTRERFIQGCPLDMTFSVEPLPVSDRNGDGVPAGSSVGLGGPPCLRLDRAGLVRGPHLEPVQPGLRVPDQRPLAPGVGVRGDAQWRVVPRPAV